MKLKEKLAEDYALNNGPTLVEGYLAGFEAACEIALIMWAEGKICGGLDIGFIGEEDV